MENQPIKLDKKVKIKGIYLLLGGIIFFILGKILYGIFPKSLLFQSIATMAELSWWIFVIIGIITMLRERRKKKNEQK